MWPNLSRSIQCPMLFLYHFTELICVNQKEVSGTRSVQYSYGIIEKESFSVKTMFYETLGQQDQTYLKMFLKLIGDIYI